MTAAAPAERSAAMIRTLICDDEPLARERLLGLLSAESDIEVLGQCRDGEEAVSAIHERHPDLVLLDVEMPRMDGFDLTRNVRGDPRLKDLPVIMITSRTADKHRKHAAELGVTVFLGKPYEERELLANIAGVVRTAA